MAAKKWGEYLFLLNSMLLAVFWAVLIDAINVWHCPEYFVVGKGLPEETLFRSTIWLAIRASYWVGLILGTLLLSVASLGNRKPLPLPQTYRMLLYPLLMGLLFSLLTGFHHLFYFEWWLGHERHGLETPQRFAFVWGMNKGAYLGAAAGTMIAVIHIVRKRS